MTEQKGVAVNTKEKKSMNALECMAGKLMVDPMRLKEILKKTAFKECKTDEEFAAALIVANKYGLNPLLNQIYVFSSRGGAIVPVVPIDGWIELVKRSNTGYEGVQLIENYPNNADKSKDLPESVTAKFFVKGQEKPVEITEYMVECRDEKKEPWRRWPRRMLRHKAYIQGARVAFGLSGIFDEDEAERIVEAQIVEESHMKPEVEMPKALPKAEKNKEELPKEPEKENIIEEQAKEIEILRKKFKFSKDDIKGHINSKYGIVEINNLNKDQAKEVISFLKRMGGSNG